MNRKINMYERINFQFDQVTSYRTLTNYCSATEGCIQYFISMLIFQITLTSLILNCVKKKSIYLAM